MFPKFSHPHMPRQPKLNEVEQPAKSGGLVNFLKRHLGLVPYHDPNIHQNIHQRMSDTEAFINLIKCTFGTGVLTMPRAFYNTGWLLGLICTFLVASSVVCAMNLLLNDINVICKRHKVTMLSYSEAMNLGILNGPQWIRGLNVCLARQVDAFLCLYHFGVDCVYVAFIGKNLKDLGDIYLSPIDMRIYMALITLPLMLTFIIRNLKYLVPFAVIANLFMIISFGCIFSYLFTDLPDLSEREAIQNLSQFPLFFGTILFSIEALGVILALQMNMKMPDHYLGKFGVLNKAMCTVIIFYAAFGFMGYWQYGDDTSISILNNLPADDPLSQYIKAMFVVAIFFSYALQGYVAIEIIWRSYMAPRLRASATQSLEYLVRMAMVVATVLCAMSYPDFGLLLSLVGSLCLTQLGLIYPGILNICVRYGEGYGQFKIILWRSLFFITMGLCGGIAGTVVSIEAINEKYDDRIKFFLSSFHLSR